MPVDKVDIKQITFKQVLDKDLHAMQHSVLRFGIPTEATIDALLLYGPTLNMIKEKLKEKKETLDIIF